MSLTPSTMLPLGTKAPNFKLPTTKGEVSLSDLDDKKVLVVVFMCNHCPYVIHILDGFIDLVNEYKNGKVAFVGINSNDAESYSADSFEKMKELDERQNLPFIYAYDENQEIAKEYKAACTPDFYVFNEDRELVYRGQMDNSRPGNSKPVTGEDLRSAINAVLVGNPVFKNQKPSSGCNIKWKPGNQPNY